MSDRVMTFQKAKDEVAKKHHFDDWAQIKNSGMAEDMFEIFTDQAAELYARSKWDECYRLTGKYAKISETTGSVLFIKPEFQP